MHPLPVGSTFPGLNRHPGSNKFLKLRIISRLSSENCEAISSIFSIPTPCSPVMEPPAPRFSCQMALSISNWCTRAVG